MSESDAGAPQPPAESAEAARERRLRALRELTRPPVERGQPDGQSAAATDGDQSVVSSGVQAGEAAPRPQHRRARVALWASAAVALCIALIVVCAAYGGLIPGVSFKAKAPTPAISMTSHDLRDANITCFQDSAWSPTGDRLAILGYQSACSTIFQVDPSPIGTVAIYDMASNHIVTQFSPDTLVQPPANSIVQYQNILWSPDGQRLAVTYTVLTLGTLPGVSGPALIPTTEGVLLTDTSGARAHARTLGLAAGQAIALAEGNFAISGEWDVTTGKVITQHINTSSATSSAVAFQWGANGALQPLNDGASKVIGNPSGGQTFSVWQPGSAQLGVAALNNDPNTLSVIPGLYLWNTTFAAWSPDGRYFYAPFAVGRRVILPGQPAPNPQTLHTTGFDQSATITPRDSSFTSLCQSLLQYANAGNQSGVFPEVAVAWRLDGRVLAAQTFASDANGNVTPSFYTVTLYDTVTGRVLARLSHDAHLAATADGAFGLVRWSPDGKHLALADSAFNTLTIWAFNKPLV